MYVVLVAGAPAPKRFTCAHEMERFVSEQVAAGRACSCSRA